MSKVIELLRRPVTGIMLSILIGFMVGSIVLMISGYNPIQAYITLFQGVFSQPRSIVQTIIIATPIIITGISVAFAFKTGLFNIGADGQFMVGAIAAAFVGYMLPLPMFVHPVVVILAAMLVGGLYGAFAGFLKAKFGIHEVITSIMLNWIALYLNNLYIQFPNIRKPGTEASWEVLNTAMTKVMGTFKETEEGRNFFSENEFLREVVFRTDLNYGIIIAIIVAIIVSFVLKRTTLGFSLRAVGQNKDAAEFSGIDIKKNIILSMGIAGAIAGLAGALHITGTNPHRITMLVSSEGYGFDGLSVALIANSSPIGSIFSGLFYAMLKHGSASMQAHLGVPNEIINIVIGTIIFFIAMSRIFVMIADRLEKKQLEKVGAEK